MEQFYRYYEERDSIFYSGLGLIAVCLGLYSYSLNSFLSNDSAFYLIVTNYSATILYLVLLCLSNYKRSQNIFKQTNRYHYICLMSLATISCLTLNIEINVFDNFSLWVDGYLAIMYSGLIAFCFFDKFPYWARIPIFFALGMGTIMASYFTLFLLPLMPFGLMFSFVFGLSLHLIVPLLVLIHSIVLFIRTEKTKKEKTAYSLGITIPIVIALLFVAQWTKTNELIQTAHQESTPNAAHGLPSWVHLSQQLSDGFFTQRILKGKIVYTTFSDGWDIWNQLGMNSFDDKKEHDPLVAIASFFSGDLSISRADRIQIIKFYSNNRHDAHRKLWSGKSLSTTDITSTTAIYPEYRLAYTEKKFTIKNNSQQSWGQEEALYTFYLPEGSVASSLSLWVNGIEEKSRLTTRSKADKAYSEIVGVQKRDPALLHWQEGNRLTVTVFPCTKQEDRIFKIGITSPMSVQQNKLILPAITFEGPSHQFANIKESISFPSQKESDYTIDHNGNIICPKTPLSTQHFSFAKQTYWAEDYQSEQRHFDPNTIYLDINRSWTEHEFETICNLYADKAIYIYYNNKLHPIKATNKTLFNRLNQNNFSLFPIDLIKDRSQALLISKSTKKSPNLQDLEGTSFSKGMIKTLTENKTALAFYNLSNHLSPYLQSLKEFYVFNYEQGSLNELKTIANNKQFPAMHPSSNAVVFHHADMVLYSQDNEQQFESKAPDHLMRLFSYNQILKKIGTGYFVKGYENEELVKIAKQAHIVSPISSMIVLETKKDYERFDIEENEDGLGNATTKNKGLKNAAQGDSGAVPEPHEWVFIVLLLSGLTILQLRRKF